MTNKGIFPDDDSGSTSGGSDGGSSSGNSTPPLEGSPGSLGQLDRAEGANINMPINKDDLIIVATGNIKGISLDDDSGTGGSSNEGSSSPSSGGSTPPLEGSPGSLGQLDRIGEPVIASVPVSNDDLVVIETPKDIGEESSLAVVEQPSEHLSDVIQETAISGNEHHEHISEVPENSVHSAEYEQGLQIEHPTTETHDLNTGTDGHDTNSSWGEHIQNSQQHGHENIPGH